MGFTEAQKISLKLGLGNFFKKSTIPGLLGGNENVFKVGSEEASNIFLNNPRFIGFWEARKTSFKLGRGSSEHFFFKSGRPRKFLEN